MTPLIELPINNMFENSDKSYEIMLEKGMHIYQIKGQIPRKFVLEKAGQVECLFQCTVS